MSGTRTHKMEHIWPKHNRPGCNSPVSFPDSSFQLLSRIEPTSCYVMLPPYGSCLPEKDLFHHSFHPLKLLLLLLKFRPYSCLPFFSPAETAQEHLHRLSARQLFVEAAASLLKTPISICDHQLSGLITAFNWSMKVHIAKFCPYFLYSFKAINSTINPNFYHARCSFRRYHWFLYQESQRI